MERLELIEMALNEIARDCRIVERVNMESKAVIAVCEAKGKPVDDVLKRITKQHEDMLKVVHKMARDLMEFTGEYMNSCDMVEGVDVALSKVVYDLVYERTTEKDYE